MKGLIQRVKHANVSVAGEVVGEIGPGIVLLLGIEKADDEARADKLLQKVLNYRIFSDAADKMNLSLLDVQGGLLVVSQFTLVADTSKGLRPSFSSGAVPAEGERLYNYFVQQARSRWPQVATGIYAADMQVALVNEGPVTFLLET